MSRVVLKPSVELQGLVFRYIAFTATGDLPPLVLPAWNKQKLMFVVGDDMVAEVGERVIETAPVTLSGAATRPYTVRTLGDTTRFFAVELTPVGYLTLLRHHGTEAVDEVLSGFDALPTPVRGTVPLRAVARDYQAPHEQKRAVESWLFRHVPHPGEMYRLRHVHRAVQLIRDRGGDIRMAELALEVGVSGALLRRQFQWTAGISPKQYAMRTRDGLAFNRVMDDGGRSSARVAFELGYADQSHMIRCLNRHVAGSETADLRQFGATRMFT